MIKPIIILSTVILFNQTSQSQNNQINRLRNILQYALKNNYSDTVSSVIKSNSEKDINVIKNIWVKLCNEVPFNDSSRINLEVNLIGENKDTIYIQFIPFFKNPSPIERSFELYSPIYKLIKTNQSLYLNKVLFINREIDHIKYDTKVTINPLQSYADIKCSLDFKLNHSGFKKAVLNLYPDFRIKELLLNNRKTEFTYNYYNLILSIPDNLINSDTLHLEISYDGKINDEDYMFILKNEGMLCFRPWLPNANALTEYWLNTEDTDKQDEFEQNYEVKLPIEYCSIADFGQLIDSKVIGNMRVENWKALRTDHLGIIYGKWQKFDVKPIGNLKPTIYLTKNSELLLDTLTKKVSDLVTFYSKTFGEPSNKTFRIVDAPVYWNCENYITSNLGIIDHEMAHYWWLSLKLNWFFHGLTEYSLALFYQNKYGEENLTKRLSKYWNEYYVYITNNTNAVLNNNAMLVYSLGTIMQYHLMSEMGKDNYLKMCKKLIAINYDKNTYSYNQLVSLIKEITGKDYEWFFNQWRYNTVKPEYSLDYSMKNQDKEYIANCTIYQKSIKYRSSLDLTINTEKSTIYKTIDLIDSLTYTSYKSDYSFKSVVLNPSNSLLAYQTKQVKSIVNFTSKEIEYSKAKRWSDILTLCDSIIQCNPTAISKWYKAKAAYQIKNNQLKDAKITYEKAIESFDKTIERLDMLSSIYLELGKTCDLLYDRNQAIYYYNKIVQSMNSRPEAKALAIKFLIDAYKKD